MTDKQAAGGLKRRTWPLVVAVSVALSVALTVSSLAEDRPVDENVIITQINEAVDDASFTEDGQVAIDSEKLAENLNQIDNVASEYLTTGQRVGIAATRLLGEHLCVLAWTTPDGLTAAVSALWLTAAE